MLKLFKKKAKPTSEVAPREEDLVETTMYLDKFSIGQSGVIKSIGGDGKIRRRLFDMGVTPGAEVYLRKKAPLGDPLEVTIRDYELTLRKSEAAQVLLETRAPKSEMNEAGESPDAAEVKK